jgi:hypothetical protein
MHFGNGLACLVESLENASYQKTKAHLSASTILAESILRRMQVLKRVGFTGHKILNAVATDSTPCV